VEMRGSVVEENSSYEVPYLRKYIKIFIVHFVAPSHFILHPKAVKFKGRLLNDGPWPLNSFLQGFSFQV
jgi:hypothetical protein